MCVWRDSGEHKTYAGSEKNDFGGEVGGEKVSVTEDCQERAVSRGISVMAWETIYLACSTSLW